jgi:hypothetical protein
LLDSGMNYSSRLTREDCQPWVISQPDLCGKVKRKPQHAEYMLAPEAGKTRVRFDLTVEPKVAVPVFLLKRASRIVMENATEGLRRAVEG